MPSDQDILSILGNPIGGDAADDTIRIGLVLNGTVSAGAWTAGVLDALIEALDAWQDAKGRGAEVPLHKVRLDIMGGASGGAVCAALLARAATRRFPPARDPQHNPDNPFWTVWVETLDIAAMLDTADLDAADASAESLLSGLAIQRAVDAILQWQGQPFDKPRPWLADPLHMLVTHTNLRGVPVEISFAPGRDGRPRISQYVMHTDHRLFALPQSARSPASRRGDALVVPPDFQAGEALWQELALNARGSGAFPGGFPAVRLKRPAADYQWRALMLPAGGGKDAEPMLLKPAWPGGKPPDPYAYDVVDGGAINNSPIELVRQNMAGLGNSLQRDGMQSRALVLVLDPFAATSAIAAPDAKPLALPKAIGQLAGALVANGRFATADLLLALDPNVGSRFLLTAGRKRNTDDQTAWGGEALATSGLGAFMGFIDRELRRHDFLLGRANAFAWMRRHFTLPAGNPVFRGPGNADFLRDGELPVIPVMPELQATQPPWPVPEGDAAALQGAIDARLRAVVSSLADGVFCKPVLARFIAGWAAGQAKGSIKDALGELQDRE
ncbi:MAG: patatin-like phospholipase family protein [Alphaproteobacteria bacterium]|nr:patatin-like phospholipase family protein [Alphaproteobacteria bacterium]